MTSKIIISINKTLEEKLLSLFSEEDARRILSYGETFPFQIETTDWKPMFPSKAQIAYLEKLKDSKLPKPESYRIYIGDDINEVTEKPNGVELPSQILDNKTLFRKEVLYRIKEVIGSPRDN